MVKTTPTAANYRRFHPHPVPKAALQVRMRAQTRPYAE